MSQPPEDRHRLYLDEDVDAGLAEALRQHGYDVETVVVARMRGASDQAQLAYAAGQRRVFITHNVRHFPSLCAAWAESGQHHSGVVVLIDRADVGTWLRRMEALLLRFSPKELRDGLFFLGAAYDSPG